MSDSDLPFRAEYAKSGRAGCKGCRTPIAKDSLRLAKMVQSQHFDGKQPSWFHFNCFFMKNKPKIIHDIAGVDGLRWDDQEKIKNRFGIISSPSTSSASSSQPLDVTDSGVACNAGDYKVEYAKSNRSKCKHCELTIDKLDVRVAIMVDDHVKFTAQCIPSWHHVKCFKTVKKASPEMTNLSEKDLDGFESLNDADKKMLKKELGLKKASTAKVAAKVAQKDAKEENAEIALREQVEKLWKLRDNLKRNCSTSELKDLLDMNGLYSRGGQNDLLERCADVLMFGVPDPCPDCGHMALHFKSDRYKCEGHLSGWTKCLYETKKPSRTKIIISDDLKEACDFLNTFKPKVCERICPKSSDPEKPLANRKVLISGIKGKQKEDIAQLVGNFGGIVVQTAVMDLYCCICTQEEIQKGLKRTQQMQDRGVALLSENFLTETKRDSLEAMISKHELVPTKSKLPELSRKRENPYRSFSAASPKKSMMVLKNGAVVDPDCELAPSTHVYQESGNIYSAILGMVDLVRGSNSYYKLQLLEHDHHKRYYVFRSWGRVGTTIGGTKTEDFYDLEDALENFTDLFAEKTGNYWHQRKNFIKHPNKFYILEMDYGQDDEKIQKLQKMKTGEGSKLSLPVQELIRMIFDVDSMKKTMAEFEIDLNKMPLGKISRRQIQSAYRILGELQKYIEENASKSKFLDASNRFFTLIPHDFGMRTPPLLDRESMIKSKMEMLESLLDIEMAYSLLTNAAQTGKNPIDVHYEGLKADIKEIDRATTEFEKIQEYIQNTHASTHNQYGLEIIDAFALERQGEESRYSPFKELHNRRLLWHGSRTSNYAGIILQGLRIAPPEAPVTGYMFGKGIYFADMVSKSANYCHTSPGNNVGLLLLCEVALGNMYEKCNADSSLKLPKGKHSCKGCGRTGPDPKMDHVLPDGTIMPLGKGIRTKDKSSDLLYNEYIVYDVAQVHMKYLLKVNFKYKY
eukprot:gene12686-13988_t